MPETLEQLVRQLAEKVLREKPKDPRPWHKIRRPHQVTPEGEWRVWSMMGGRGCVSGDTLIWANGQYVRVDTLSLGGEVEVLGISDAGAVKVKCPPPFVKGTARLLEFVLDSGETVRVAPEHRFLVPGGWREASRFSVGSLLGCAANHPQSIWDTAREGCPRGERRCSRTTPSCPGDCSACRCPYDGQPLREEDSDRVFPPSQGDARGWSSQSGTAGSTRRHQSESLYPFLDDTRWARVVSITESATEEPYYDLQVPGCNSYLANGIWHHNSGKSRTGAEMCQEWATAMPGSRGILVGRSANDVRNTMLEGESGLRTLYPAIEYNSSFGRLTWPNGTVAQCYYAESPNTLRGPQCHWFWADEISSWQDAHLGDREDTAWNNMIMGCRLAWPDWSPRGIATFTPKPNKLVQDILASPSTILTVGSTFDNIALDDAAKADLLARYGGTRAGRQELYGELLLTAENALWNTDLLDSNRIRPEDLPPLVKIAVAWDPATTSGEHSDEHGIVVSGLDANRHGYVLEDLSGRMTPDKAVMTVIKAFHKWNANMVVYEKNQGGDFINSLIRSSATGIPTVGVHAKLGKRLRAEPIQAKDEQGFVHHVGIFNKMETQMTTWDPDDPKQKSPDRVDARVYGLTWLFEGSGAFRVKSRIGVRK